jgi:hypothetical protein
VFLKKKKTGSAIGLTLFMSTGDQTGAEDGNYNEERKGVDTVLPMAFVLFVARRKTQVTFSSPALWRRFLGRPCASC